MYILIDKENKKGYISKTYIAISRRSGIKYNKLYYYTTKMIYNYYEDMEIIFCKADVLKSNQGGYRKNNLNTKKL